MKPECVGCTGIVDLNDGIMSVHPIPNPVLTPEEMGEFLGISSERVLAVRSIMESPVKSKSATHRTKYRRLAPRSAAKKAAKKATQRGVPRSKRPEPVFLNVPCDAQFQDLYIVYVVGLTRLGLYVTATLAHPNQDRLAKIIELIEACSFSIHDLSRIEASHGIPRFNMPLELGIALYRSTKAKHDVYVFESMAFRANDPPSSLLSPTSAVRCLTRP